MVDEKLESMAEGHDVREQKLEEVDQVERRDCDSDRGQLKDNRLHILCKEGRYKEVEAFFGLIWPIFL